MLSKDAFDALLSRLDPDAARAGEIYEELRQKLVKFFEWRRAPAPYEMADETLDRLARKVHEGAVKDSVSSFAYGIARMVILEYSRHTQRQQAAEDQLPPPAPVEARERERPELECFDHCVGQLSPDNKRLILEYYQEERTAKIELRQELAAKLNIPMNALRLRAHRIRATLEACVKGCLERKI